MIMIPEKRMDLKSPWGLKEIIEASGTGGCREPAFIQHLVCTRTDKKVLCESQP